MDTHSGYFLIELHRVQWFRVRRRAGLLLHGHPALGLGFLACGPMRNDAIDRHENGGHSQDEDRQRYGPHHAPAMALSACTLSRKIGLTSISAA